MVFFNPWIPYFLVKLGGIAARLEHEPEDPSSPSSKGAEKGNFLEKPWRNHDISLEMSSKTH